MENDKKFERQDLPQDEVDGYMIVGYHEDQKTPLAVFQELFWKAHGFRMIETLNAAIENEGVKEDNVEYYQLENARTGETILSL